MLKLPYIILTTQVVAIGYGPSKIEPPIHPLSATHMTPNESDASELIT